MHHGTPICTTKCTRRCCRKTVAFFCAVLRAGAIKSTVPLCGPEIWMRILLGSVKPRWIETEMKKYCCGWYSGQSQYELGTRSFRVSFYGADTGGYRHSPPDNETFIRWFQQTAFSVVMQVGDSSSQTPWEYNEENGRNEDTLNSYREFAQSTCVCFRTFGPTQSRFRSPVVRFKERSELRIR